MSPAVESFAWSNEMRVRIALSIGRLQSKSHHTDRVVTLIFNALHDIRYVQYLPKKILQGCRRGLLLAILICLTSLAAAQERAPSEGDIPWPAEAGAGRLTEPGRSRLPP